MASWEEFSRIVAEAKAAKKLDPVGQEDDDVDNDGDSDSSDSYLKKRRAAVGAAIDADKKKKVEEALDPVGQEDKDIDNDGDHDKSDKYLLNRRKVRAKVIPPQERLKTDRDMFNIPKSEQEAARERILAKTKAKREKMKEETEQLDEFLGTGRVVAGKSQAGYNPGSRFTQAGTVQKVLGVKIPGSFRPGASESDVARHNKAASPQSQIKKSNQSMDQLLGKKPGGQTTVGITPDKKPQPTAAPKPAAKPLPTMADKGREMRSNIDKRNAMLKQAMNQMNSYQPEGEMVEEDKEYRREMRKAAARERAEEKKAETEFRSRGRRGEKKKGPKLSTTPITDRTAKSYVDKELGAIKYMERKTKGKHTIGNPFPENYDLEGEYIEEKGMSREATLSAIKGHKYSKKELLDMSKKSTKEGRHGEASAFYHEFQKEEVETIEEKALSRAQQRFMGMVYAAKKGETPASPEVAKAASGMSKKAAKDFAKTKHEGLPEKKEETKEELSLVDRIIEEVLNEAPKGTIPGGKSKSKKYKAVAKQAKLAAAVNQVMKGDSEPESEPAPKKSEEERKETAKKQVKRGKSDPSALTRRAAVAGAAKVKAEREKTKRQRERQEYERERRLLGRQDRAERDLKDEEKAKKKELKKREKARIAAEEEKKKQKQQQRANLRKEIGSAWSTPTKVGTGKKDTDDAAAAISNVGSLVGGVAKTGIALGKYAWKRRQARKEEERQKKEEQTQKEQFSNWREEFIFEVDDQSTKQPKEKKIDVMKGKNQIQINPNMSEENIQEIAPLVGVLARVAGGAATRGIAARGAGFAARGALQKKAVDIAAQKGGEMTADMVQKRLEKKFKNEDEELEEGMTLKDFKANRKKLQRKEASVDAEKRGHVGKEWHNTGRKYSADEAKSRRANMTDDDRAARHRDAVDPDDDRDENTYSADRTKNPKKLRKQQAMGESAAWTKKAGKSESGGLNEKGRRSYERENPGSDLKAPSKKVGNPRRASFCARMSGMKAKLTSKKTANDPDSRINKSLRAWNC